MSKVYESETHKKLIKFRDLDGGGDKRSQEIIYRSGYIIHFIEVKARAGIKTNKRRTTDLFQVKKSGFLFSR